MARPACSRATRSPASISSPPRGLAAFSDCLDIADEQGLRTLAARLKDPGGLLFARVQIAAQEPPRVLPLRDGVVIKRRFRAALGFEA